MLPAEPFRPKRADWLQAAAVAAALFALYACTAPRTVALEDDGLFILSSYFLGIEHPPGYPLFTWIGHLFTYLPFGSVAYRVHLASAMFGALTCAAVWLCARALIEGRLPAYLAAFALGVSPVFWSQAIIAEVYTLNTFFFLVLVFLGLQASAHPGGSRLLPWMALLFGLSLSNHYPLMLLVAPAFLILLWPLRRELLNRFGLLLSLVIVGLLPYVWLIRRSWQPLPISFDGPLETMQEIMFFLGRKGYAGVDQSVSADWLDRLKFFKFLGGELLMQFAVLGTLLAAAGFAAQWRILGRRLSAFLTVAFLMPSAVLLLLLGFDYDSFRAHVFHVYPLPAYAVCALWMGLGFARLAQRYAWRPSHTKAAAAGLLLLIFAFGVRLNLLENHEWGARYARTVLKALPKNAVVIVTGDPDLAPMAYFHMIENWRPDITLVEPKGLILGNRLFHPLRTDEATVERVLNEMIDRSTDPVVFTLDTFPRYAQRDHWLYVELDKSSTDPEQVAVDVSEDAVQFFEESVLGVHDANAWVAFIQGELRRHYAVVLARSLPRGKPADARTQRHLELLAKDFYGALGIAEGLMANRDGYQAGVVAGFLDKARDTMPSDVPKENLSRFFYIRGVLRANVRDNAGAARDLETAVSIWPAPNNSAFKELQEHYRRTGDEAAANAVEGRVKQLKARKSR
jgi:4-amino-4-deoxy-L-arabinose transferase-like glycosyltransferase